MQTYASKIKKPGRRILRQTQQQDSLPDITGNIDLAGGGRGLDLPDTLHSRVQTQFGLNLDSICVNESQQTVEIPAVKPAAPVTPIPASSAPVQGKGKGKRILSGISDWWKEFKKPKAQKEDELKQKQLKDDEANFKNLKVMTSAITGTDLDEKTSNEMFNYEDADKELLLKNIMGISRVQDEFGGFDVQGIRIRDLKDSIASFNPLFSDSNEEYGNYISFNTKSFLKKERSQNVNNGKRELDGRYGTHTAGPEYSGIHEAGHAVNAEILNKIYGIDKTTERFTKGVEKGEGIENSLFLKDKKHRLTSSIIMQEAVLRAYKTDKTFKRKMEERLKLGSGVDNDEKEKAVIDQTFSDRDIENAKTYKGDDIKKCLYDMGYTSAYGASNSAELFAEAFADYYATKDRNAAKEEKRKKWGIFGKFIKDEKMNPLTQAIIDISRELLDDDETKRNEFMKRNSYI